MIIVKVGGVIQRIKIDSFHYEDSIDERSTCSFVVVNLDYNKTFQKGQPVSVYSKKLVADSDWRTGAIEPITLDTDEFFIQPEFVIDMEVNPGEQIFSGVIEAAEGINFTNEGILFYRIDCIDYHYAADKRIAVKAYNETTAGEIIVDLWESYLKEEGIALGTEAACTFTNASNTVNATGHGLSVNDRVRFYTEGTLPAEVIARTWYYVRTVPNSDTFTISETEGGSEHAFTDDGTGSHSFVHSWLYDEGENIEEAVFNYVPVSQCFDAISERAMMWWRIDEHSRLIFRTRATYTAPWTVTASDVLNGSLSIQHAAPKYRNKQIIRGPIDETSEQIEFTVGDGESQAFPLGYPLAKVPTIDIDYDGSTGYVNYGVGIKGIDSTTAWFWNKGDAIIAQQSSDAPLIAADTMRVTYTGQYPIVVISRDYGAIADRLAVEEKGTGIVEDVRQEPQQSTRDAVFEMAAQLLNKYKDIGNTVKFLTYRQGLRPGHLVTVNLPKYNINSVEMLIDTVTMRTVGPDLLLCDIQCVEGPDIGSWTKVFGDIIKSGRMVIRENIAEDEVVLQAVQFTKDWNEAEGHFTGDSPNIFIELYPSSDPMWSDVHGLSFVPENRTKYVAWFDSSSTGDEVARKPFTLQTGASMGSTQMYTATYLNPFDAVNEEIHYLGWFGGMTATTTTGSGLLIDFQPHPSGPSTKTDLEAWDIQKTDNKWV